MFFTIRFTRRPFSMVKLLCISLLLFFSANISQAQQRIDYSIHANIIYYFTKYIDWPENKKQGDFIIGVIGETPLFEELKKVSLNKSVGSQQIVIKKYSPSQSSYDAHILFISVVESDRLKTIAIRTEDSPVLIVCEEEGTSSRGACINFGIEKERIKLFINKNNIINRKMKIAGELLRLGTIVK